MQKNTSGDVAQGENVLGLLDAIPVHVATVDADGRIATVNAAWGMFAAQAPEAPLMATPGALYAKVAARIDASFFPDTPVAEPALRAIQTGQRQEATFTCPCDLPSGLRRWFRVELSRIDTSAAKTILVTHFDITEEMRAREELFERSHFDALTGLPNRLLFLDRLRQDLAAAERHGKRVAVAFLNLDRFREINETLGHPGGDSVLRETAQRLSGSLRKSDTAGRLSGDEFGVIITDLGEACEASSVAHKLMAEIAKPYLFNGLTLSSSACVGIALYPEDATDPEMLLHCAGSALYRAKESGLSNCEYFTQEMNQDALERLRLSIDLRKGLEQNQFELHYQPKINCTSGEIIGAEALLRWRHPTRGLVSPCEFVPILEENGLIVEVGLWVLREACRQTRRWIDQGLGKPTVAVNVSSRQFEDGELVANVCDALEQSGLPADRLELELTESILMRNVDRGISILSRLKQMGIHFSVDDFGTGYSSLSYLKRFPLNAVKVDRSFVQDITADPDDASITRAIITMAHNLKMKVIAEGVETEGQLSLLIANQCDVIQGFYFSQPVPAEEFGRLLADRSRLPSLPSNKRERTLLLVDDEENILASLRRLLRRDGYRILTANSGDAGLELLAGNTVDVIVSDQRMPGMTGVEFLRRVKTIHPNTVRMVLSGYTELQSITDAINEGAIYKFLTKPWEDDLLRVNIEEAFRHKELADENRRLSAEIQVANKELARSNSRLLTMLAEKDRLIERDTAVLDTVQEVLQCLPFPVIGMDDEDMIVFSNGTADALFGGGQPLITASLSERLPEPLRLLTEGRDGDTCSWADKRQTWQALYRVLGSSTVATGRLLILLPKGA